MPYAHQPLCWFHFGKHKNIFTFSSSTHSMRWHRWLTSFFKEDKKLFTLHRKCYDCWCLGDKRRQGISSHGIDLVLQEYSSLITRRFDVIVNYCWISGSVPQGSIEMQGDLGWHYTVRQIGRNFITVTSHEHRGISQQLDSLSFCQDNNKENKRKHKVFLQSQPSSRILIDLGIRGYFGI